MLAFIDCYIERPVHHCFNQYLSHSKRIASYHMVSQFGFDSLDQLASPPSGIIILGSASNITENLTWHTELAKRIDTYLQKNIPVLGICFGHQLMANFYGCKVGYLSQKQEYFTETRKITFLQDLGSYNKEETLELAYAHEQAVLQLSDQFIAIAKSARSEYECLKHKTLPLLTTQAHPEASALFYRETLKTKDNKTTIQNGLQFIDNFLDIYQVPV